MSNFKLVEEIRNGDVRAFEDLFNNHCQRLINFSRRYVREKEIAENIVQDVFLRVWQNRSNLDPSQMIHSYLFTSVKNESLKYLRHLDVEHRGEDRVADSINKEKSPEQEIEGNELTKEIYKAISELPEKCREIFKMNRFDKLKYAEIAKILDISIKTVETQMGRALKKLRERLSHLLSIIIILYSQIFFK